MNPNNVYIIRIGYELDFTDIEYMSSNVICKIFKTDEFSGETTTEKYSLVLKPILDNLPLGLKDLNYFVMYNVDGVWSVFDIETIDEPRNLQKIEDSTGLVLRTQL